MKKFRCKICGYVFEKEEISDGYICPSCGVSHMMEEIIEKIKEFKKIRRGR